jgi:hypothetical protein
MILGPSTGLLLIVNVNWAQSEVRTVSPFGNGTLQRALELLIYGRGT